MEPRGGRLRRSDRLRKSAEFRRVSAEGRRRAGGSFILLCAPARQGEGAATPRIGLTVSRKVGGAVQRNLVKRRLRAWFRSSWADLETGRDYVVIARAGAAGLDYAELVAELKQLAAAHRAASA